MPIEVQWDNPHHTIIATDFINQWTWVEFSHVMQEKTHKMVSDSKHTVHIIVDIPFSATTSMAGALLHLRKAISTHTHNWGLLVFVNISPFIAILIDLFKRTNPDLAERIFIVDNRDAAYVLIQQKDAASFPSDYKQII